MLSPGVPLTHPKPHWTVAKAKAAGVEMLGDVELFARTVNAAPEHKRPKVIAITGTNGKSDHHGPDRPRPAARPARDTRVGRQHRRRACWASTTCTAARSTCWSCRPTSWT